MKTRDNSRYHEALAEIARIAGTASQGIEYSGSGGEEGSLSVGDIGSGCRIKALPGGLHEKAAQVAALINPVNAPLRELLPGA